MVSKIFVLGDGDSRSVCMRILLILLVISAIIIAITLCVFAFRSNGKYWPVCPPPALDANGLSNWTSQSEAITYGCLPGYTFEGNESKSSIVSRCELDGKQWVPSPPVCIHVPYLPILLACNVSHNGLEGQLSIWKENTGRPTFVAGHLNMSNVNRTGAETVRSEFLEFSYSTCTVTHEDYTTPVEEEQVDCSTIRNCFNIRFNSSDLIPYKKMELRVTMVVVDTEKTMVIAILVQEGLSMTEVVEVATILGSNPTTTTAGTGTDSADIVNLH